MNKEEYSDDDQKTLTVGLKKTHKMVQQMRNTKQRKRYHILEKLQNVSDQSMQ